MPQFLQLASEKLSRRVVIANTENGVISVADSNSPQALNLALPFVFVANKGDIGWPTGPSRLSMASPRVVPTRDTDAGAMPP